MSRTTEVERFLTSCNSDIKRICATHTRKKKKIWIHVPGCEISPRVCLWQWRGAVCYQIAHWHIWTPTGFVWRDKQFEQQQLVCYSVDRKKISASIFFRIRSFRRFSKQNLEMFVVSRFLNMRFWWFSLSYSVWQYVYSLNCGEETECQHCCLFRSCIVTRC